MLVKITNVSNVNPTPTAVRHLKVKEDLAKQVKKKALFIYLLP